MRKLNSYPFHQEHFLKDLQGLLRIKSVREDCGPVTKEAPLGQGIYDSLEYVLDLAKTFGFRTKNLDGYCGWVEMGEGKELLAILAHLDTVSVETEGWVAPPFDLTELDGKLYGRGVSDDKGPALLGLYAMKAVADSGVALTRRVRLILGGDEEGGGWRCMKRYRETEELPTLAFTPDSQYPATFAEKGILHVRFSRSMAGVSPVLELLCDNAYNVVPAYARAKRNGKAYEATGRSAHAMTPEKGDNALLKLCKTLRESGIDHPFLTLASMANREALGIAFSDEPSGALSFNPSFAHVDALKAELGCDLRVPVTYTDTDILEKMSKAVEPLGFIVTVDTFQPPLHVAKDSLLVTTLQDIYHACTGRNDPPRSSGGGTYARAFQNAVAFGALFPGEPVTYHQTNEYWPLDSLPQNFQIIANAIAALA